MTKLKKISAIRNVLLVAIIFAIAILFSACGEDNSKQINKIIITQSKVELVVGASEQLTLTLSPSNASNADLVFVSADTKVAVVDKNGNITAVASGETEVSVTATSGGASAVVKVIVFTNPEKLNTVTNIKFDGEKVVWDRVNHNYGYAVTLNGEPYTKTLVTEFFTDFEIGVQNVISIRALGNNKAYLDAENSVDFTFTQLSAPNISIENAKITITPNSNANMFEIIMNGETHKNRYTELTYLIEDELDVGFYAFKVRALGNVSNNTYNSNFSNTITITKLEAPIESQVEDKILTFKSVVGAQNYRIWITDNASGAQRTEIVNATSTYVEYNLGETYRAGGYNIYVQALGDGRTTLDSAYSMEFAVDKLSKPQNVEINNGIVTWDEVSNATGYSLKVEYGDKTTIEEDLIDERFDFASKYVDVGNYKLSVIATGGKVNEQTRFVNSDYSDILSVTKLEAPKSFSINGDDVTWKTVASSTGYIVLLNDTRELPIQTQNYINLFDTDTQKFTAQKYIINTKAVGNGKEIVDSEFSQSFEFRKISTIEVSKVTLSGGKVQWQGVGEAILYDVYVNDSNEPVRVSGTSFDFSSSTYDSGNYSIKIQAISTDTLSVSGEKSEAITFEKLSCPTDFKVDGGHLYYSMASGASYLGYNLRVGNMTYLSVNDEYLDFDRFLSDDEVNLVSLQAIGDGQSTISSNFSEPIKLHKLSSNMGLKIENGNLSWNTQSGATGYNIEIKYVASGVTNKQTMFVDGADVAFINLTDSTLFANAGDYDISMRAIGATSDIDNAEYTYDITSRLSGAISAKRLASVIKLNVKNGLITWDAVDGVTYYEVILDGNSLGSTCGNVNTYTVAGTAGDHTVSVIARGNKSNILDSKVVSNETSVVKLTNVFTFSVEKNIIKWNSVAGANSYDVEIVDQNNTIVGSARSIADTSYTLYGLSGGTSYYVRVKANGNNTDTVNGEFGGHNGAKNFEAKILAEPRNIRIENYTLYFDYVANATGYEIVFSQTGEPDSIEITSTKGVNGGEYDVAKYLSGKGAGTYTVYMRSVDKSATQEYLYSSYSKSINIEKLDVPILSVVNGTINYSKIYSAVEYKIEIGKLLSESKPTDYYNSKNVTTFELGENFTAGEYSVSITAMGNGSTIFSSDKSAEFSVEKLKTPIAENGDIQVKDGQLYWKGIDNATLYKIYVYKSDELNGDTLSYETYLQPKSENYYLPTGEMGTYKISISVLGDDTKYINSDVYKYTQKLEKLNAPKDLGVTNGDISWTRNERATSYELILNDDTYIKDVETNTTYSLGDAYSAMGYEVAVRCVGDSIDKLTSDPSDEIWIEKLKQTILYVENGVLNWASNGAQKYHIVIMNDSGVAVKDEDIEENSFEFKEIETGYYFVKVTLLGTEQQVGSGGYLNSASSEEFCAYKMATPENLHINSNFEGATTEEKAHVGRLEWNAVDNALNYSISYTYKTIPNSINVDTNYYRFGNDELWVGQYVFGVFASGDVVTKDIVMDGNTTTKSFSCINSDIAQINGAKLGAPTDLSADYGVFRWTASEGSEELDVKYMFGYYYAEKGQEFDMGTINIEFADSKTFHTLNKLGKYKLLVYAVGENCIQSDTSELADEYLFNLFSSGSGETDDPYIIKGFTDGEGVSAKTYTALEQLTYLNYLYDKAFKLDENVTISSSFAPLGTKDTLSFAKLGDYGFEGVFDGNNHTITFSTGDDTSSAFGGTGEFGLFSSISAGGVVKNFTLEKFTVSGSYYKIGLVTAKNSGSIENVKATSTTNGITSAYSAGGEQTYVGGIAGENTNTGVIANCLSQIRINATNTKTFVYAGGIVGYNSGVIKNCETRVIEGSEKQIQGTYVGGIAGYCVGVAGVIESCKNSASINATPSQGELGSAFARAGGIAGTIEYTSASETGAIMPQVIACYNTGLVNARANGDDSSESGTKVGGIVGLIAGGIIDTCYNVGTTYIYNDNDETFTENTGAIVGWNTNSVNSYINNSYYIEGVGIPNACTMSTQTLDTVKMEITTKEKLQAESGTDGAIIDKLNKANTYFSCVAGNYPKLIWEV